ncbi:hypothetical protein WICPIJ_007132, partial [Wickerhamomyces pijperi]
GDVIPNQIPDDVIVTRSMSKKMPIKYEQIGADVKIIKLLLSEFKFQEKSAQRAQHAQQVQKPDSDDDGQKCNEDKRRDPKVPKKKPALPRISGGQIFCHQIGEFLIELQPLRFWRPRWKHV